MHVITNDRFTALESIDADQLTAVTGGAGEGNNPPADDKKKKGGKLGIGGFLLEKAVGLITRPVSDQFKAHAQYEMEARRSRLLSDAYGPANGSTSR